MAFLQPVYNVPSTVHTDTAADKVRKAHSHLLNGDDSRLFFAISKDVDEPGSFYEAVNGVNGIIHAASPSVLNVQDIERGLFFPAINGTTEALKVIGTHYARAYKSCGRSTASCVSETFTEKAAWYFVEEQNPNFDLATICPPMIYRSVEKEASMDHLNASIANIYWLMNGTPYEPGPTVFPGTHCSIPLLYLRISHSHETQTAFAHVPSPHSSRYLIVSFQYPDNRRILKEGCPHVRPKYLSRLLRKRLSRLLVTAMLRGGGGVETIPLKKAITDAAESLVRFDEGRI